MSDTGIAVQPKTSDPALEELREAYTSGDLVVFVGAGVSAAAGLPSWKRLVEVLVEHAMARQVDKAAVQEILDLVAGRQLIDALSALKAALGGDEFCAIVERHLDDRGKEVPRPAMAIAKLAPRLRAIITTNLDHLLERALEGAWPALPRVTADLARRRGFILKLHGTLLDRSTWVFTRDEYDRVMFADPVLKNTFSALFHSCPLLFVGYGLSDADFDVLLGQVRALTGDQSLRHWALVPAESATPHRRRMLEDAGVRLIPYPNEDGRHGEVVTTLEWLTSSGPLAAPAAPAPEQAPRPPEPLVRPLPPREEGKSGPRPPSPREDVRPRRPRWLLLGGALLGLAALGTLGTYAWQRRQAAIELARQQEEAARRKAQAEERSRELANAAQEQFEKDPQLALALVAKALASAPTPQAEAALAAWTNQRGRLVLSTGAPVAGAAFSPDGKRVVTAGANGESQIWDLASRKRTAFFRTSPHAMTWAAFDAEGREVAVLVKDGTLRLWNSLFEGRVKSWRSMAATAAAVNPAAREVAVTSPDGKVWVEDDEAGDPLELRAPPGRFGTVAFSSDGRHVVAGGEGGTVRVWEVASGKSMELSGHTSRVTVVAFSPDGKRIASAGEDGALRLWDAASGKPAGELRGHTGAVMALAFSPDGGYLVSSGADRIARLWSTASGSLVALLSGHARELTGVAFSPDGRRIATASADGTARLWAANPGVSSGGSPPGGQVLLELKGHGAPVRAVSFSPDGRLLLTAGDDGTARLWDLARDPATVLQGHRSWVRWARFTPDGRTVVSLGEDGVRLWEAGTGLSSRTLDAESGVFTAAALSRDGTRVVTANPRTPLWIWDLTSEQRIELPAPYAGVFAVDLGPDGKQVAAGAVDGAVWLWDASGKPRKVGAHEGQVTSVAFSNDGALLVTAGEDGTARLWDVATGRERSVLRGHTQAIFQAQLSPDGRRVLTSGREGHGAALGHGLRRPAGDARAWARVRHRRALPGRAAHPHRRP